MPISRPKLNGSTAPSHIPYGPADSFKWEDFPEYGGAKSTIFRSADGTIVASSATETGKASLMYPCSEFFYVTKGWIKCSIHGGETFTLREGDCTFLPKGTTVDFEFGDGFTNVAVFLDDERITLV